MTVQEIRFNTKALYREYVSGIISDYRNGLNGIFSYDTLALSAGEVTEVVYQIAPKTFKIVRFSHQ